MSMREREMFERSFDRPRDYFKLSAESQWQIDKQLGILDWMGLDLTFEDMARFRAHYAMVNDKSVRFIVPSEDVLKEVTRCVGPYVVEFMGPSETSRARVSQFGIWEVCDIHGNLTDSGVAQDTSEARSVVLDRLRSNGCIVFEELTEETIPQDLLPTTCCKNVGVGGFRPCNAPAIAWYRLGDDVCSFCRDHNHPCGAPIKPL